MIVCFQIMQIPCIILLIATPFTGALYYFDNMNFYHRGELFYIWHYITILSYAFIIIVCIIYHKKIDPFVNRIIFALSFIPLIALICNIAYVGISLNNIFVSITAWIVFLMYEKNRISIAVNTARELEMVKTQLTESRLSLTESRLALAESKNEVLMAQIQPHFINNSLMALRSRCADYPEIYNSITNFSRYLRSNFEALGSVNLISFEQEMENIEAYLELEKQNFPERLSIEYDIRCDDFLIPALSVQPLVENAVRHGVTTFDKGGTVTISSCKTDSGYIITVTDQGVGKRSVTQQQTKRKSVGTENVRARLASMGSGKLEIISTDNGTTAKITISGV